MSDFTQTYTDTLRVLGETLNKMTSAEWDLMLQESTPEQRREAMKTPIRVRPRPIAKHAIRKDTPTTGVDHVISSPSPGIRRPRNPSPCDCPHVRSIPSGGPIPGGPSGRLTALAPEARRGRRPRPA